MQTAVNTIELSMELGNYHTWKFREELNLVIWIRPLAKAAQSAMLILGLFVFFHYDGIMKDIFSYAATHKHHHHEINSRSALPILSSMLECTLLPVDEAGTWDDFIFKEGL